ncbi:hypothetical protein AVEN_260761-1, partial [Araneus ventricosus]
KEVFEENVMKQNRKTCSLQFIKDTSI